MVVKIKNTLRGSNISTGPIKALALFPFAVEKKNPKTNEKLTVGKIQQKWAKLYLFDSSTCSTRRRQQLLSSAHPNGRRQTQTLQDGQGEGAGIFGWARRGRGQTLPDSLTAGRGEAMPWGKVEAAEKGSGAFSLSPIGGRRSRAEVGSQSVMNRFGLFFLLLFCSNASVFSSVFLLY